MNITVPNIDDKEFIKLRKLIDNNCTALKVKVETVDEAKENFCFQVVQDYVLRFGGEMVSGWQIWKSDIMIEAEYHAIWKNDTGEMVDISCKQLDIDEILFIPDAKNTYDGALKDNIRLNITSNPLVDNLIELSKALFRLQNRGDLIRYTGDLSKVMTQEELKYIVQLEQFKQFIITLINSGYTDDSDCYCGKKEKYKNCHGKDFIKYFRTIN